MCSVESRSQLSKWKSNDKRILEHQEEERKEEEEKNSILEAIYKFHKLCLTMETKICYFIPKSK